MAFREDLLGLVLTHSIFTRLPSVATTSFGISSLFIFSCVVFSYIGNLYLKFHPHCLACNFGFLTSIHFHPSSTFANWDKKS